MNKQHADDDNFAKLISHPNSTWLIEFGAAWCAPCKALAPVVRAIAEDFGGAFELAEVDLDTCPQTAAKYGIRAVPALVLFVDGRPCDQLVGNQPRRKIEEMLRKNGCQPNLRSTG